MDKKFLYILIVLILVIVGLYFLLGNKGVQKETEITSPTPIQTEQLSPTPTAADQTMVDCGKAENPACFIGRANSCLPVKAQMVSSDNTTQIEIMVLGVEDEKCHFQRKINSIMDLNCYFPKGTNIMNAIDQTFGNDHGLQEVVDAACANW
ncbi:MAG: hypothetical protein WC579_00715 [Candidatus Paceibacterota bacterium]